MDTVTLAIATTAAFDHRDCAAVIEDWDPDTRMMWAVATVTAIVEREGLNLWSFAAGQGVDDLTMAWEPCMLAVVGGWADEAQFERVVQEIADEAGRQLGQRSIGVTSGTFRTVAHS